jgi:hypothetical protein
MQLLTTVRKRFKKFHISDHQKTKEGKCAAADQRNLKAKASIANMATKVENDW